MLIAQTCRELEDHDAATGELNTARDIFHHLGAKPDVTRVESLLKKKNPENEGPLTTREVQVLKLIASGRTNRAIADKLEHQRKNRRPPRQQHFQQA